MFHISKALKLEILAFLSHCGMGIILKAVQYHRAKRVSPINAVVKMQLWI